MGTTIYCFIEKRIHNQWQLVKDMPTSTGMHKGANKLFSWRSYSLFGFLAGVRNYSHCTPLAEPRGLPSDVSAEIRTFRTEHLGICHSDSWFMLQEMLSFDYKTFFWDRRITSQTAPHSWDGSRIAVDEETEGKFVTYEEHLGPQYFQDLEQLNLLGTPQNIRIVFWFDE